MTVFLIGCTHFGHQNMCEFLNEDGTKVRPFKTAFDMDEVLVGNWNAVVKAEDKVYMLGDVAMSKKALEILPHLNGTKVLIKGNHDVYRLKDYTPYFKDIRGSHKLNDCILTHIPIHRDSINRWSGGNIHAHLHNKRVLLDGKIDPLYFNVSVENINYTPITLEEVLIRMKEQQEG
jgi:calcineurin-like phosphoesterase family protein